MEDPAPRVLIALFLFGACTGAAGPAGPQGPAGPAAPGDSEAGYDLTLLAKAGAAKHVHGNQYEITLTGVHPNVLAFQDRPNRGFAHFEVGSMVALWPLMFGDGNGSPNVSMTSRDLNGNSDDPVAFTMAGPSRDESRGAITFEMNLLQGSPAPLESFTDVSLFIDPTKWQWVKIGLVCGTAILAIMVGSYLALASGGTASYVAGLIAGGASVGCINALRNAGLG